MSASGDIVDFQSLNEADQTLLRKAVEVRNFAYCPYSKFPVGAALQLENGEIVTGCNVENISFTVGICAERTAMSKAISEGNGKFAAVAVIANSAEICTPCGACRQFISEFGNLRVLCAKPALQEVLVSDVKRLLPYAFSSIES